MKNGLMIVNPNEAGLMNIGDYVQALAARQYFPNIDILLDRDNDLASYQGEEVRMIMNGWFMDHPENFPPSHQIKPLLISFHINSYGLPSLLRKECVDFFKKNQPVGCRDQHTVELLKEKGVDAYFSGCLTLTLGKTYKYEGERHGIYFVDPMFLTTNLSKRPSLIFKATFSLIKNFNAIKLISKKRGSVSLRSLLHNAIFYKEYVKVFDKNILVNAEYICQYSCDIAKMSIAERFSYAESLVKKYARAQLVVTSRIHCGLPCLGLETPVIYTLNAYDGKMSTDRFGGLMNLFNTITWSGDKLISVKNKITLDNIPQNKKDWMTVAKNLIFKCEKFVRHDVVCV